jgi:hypothetical protein
MYKLDNGSEENISCKFFVSTLKFTSPKEKAIPLKFYTFSIPLVAVVKGPD